MSFVNGTFLVTDSTLIVLSNSGGPSKQSLPRTLPGFELLDGQQFKSLDVLFPLPKRWAEIIIHAQNRALLAGQVAAIGCT